jgi:NADPH-dependent 2,4-dienoyl-CoA reductase/sulfur reductase-like enzyme
LIQDGKADLVALGRPLVADPDLPNKARRGEFHRIRPCLYCNNGCMAKMEFRRTVSACTVNPWTDRDDMAELPPAGKVKKVLVVGGGPAGLEAARVAALRGHRVILYEQDGRLGGQWVLAAVPPHKDSFTRHLEWLISEVGLAGVEVRLKTVFTMNELHAEHPDAVVLATGALPVAPQIPGVENATVAWDVLRGKSPVGANVLIAGGSATGLEVAHLLAVQGRNVTVIEMASRFGADMPPTILWHLRRLLGEHGVRTMTNVRLREIRPDRTVTVETKGGEETWPGFSDVILATGVRPQIDLKDPIEASLSEVYVIGDAKKPRSGLDAIGEGAQAGLRL